MALNDTEPTSSLNLDDFLRMTDVASALRKQQDEVTRQLNFHEIKTDLKERILKTAEATGEKLTPEMVDAAINNYYEGMYSFQQPEKNLAYRLASLYVDRIKIGKRYGIPSLIATGAAGAIWLIITGVNAAHIASLERGVETTVESAYRQKQNISSTLKEVSSSSLIEQLPKSEKDKLADIISNSSARLKDSDAFFNRFCSDGTAIDDITKDNYEEAKTQLPIVQSSLDHTQSEIENGNEILQAQKQYVSLKQSLDSLIAEIRNINAPELFAQKAEIAYKNGINCINNRQISDAQNYNQQLTGIKSDMINFSRLSPRVDQLYNNIKAIAKEDAAIKQGESLYKEAVQIRSSADIQKLSYTVKQLEELDTILNQEYIIVIIGGDRRVPDDNPNLIRYYILVEARDSKGNILQRTIEHEERPGQFVTVRKWGERVGIGPRNNEIEPETYAKVKKDKTDNGVIDNNLFGKKEKGYLNPKILLKCEGKQYPY